MYSFKPDGFVVLHLRTELSLGLNVIIIKNTSFLGLGKLEISAEIS